SGSTAIQRTVALAAPATSCQVMSIQLRRGSVIRVTRQSPPYLAFFFEHDLSRKSVSTFRDHALLSRRRRQGATDAVRRNAPNPLEPRSRGRRRARIGARTGKGPRQGVVRHQLGGRGRAWRLLPGTGRWHVP